MLPELHFRISARGTHTASRHGHSTTVSSATMPLLGVIGTTACDTRSDPLHLILTVELHLLQFDFFQEVFRIQVGRFGDFLQFCFVLPVLLCQTLILGVCLEGHRSEERRVGKERRWRWCGGW